MSHGSVPRTTTNVSDNAALRHRGRLAADWTRECDERNSHATRTECECHAQRRRHLRAPQARLCTHLTDDEAKGILSSSRRAALESAVIDHRNVLVGGGTGIGKTTFVNALLKITAERTEDRLLVIEDTPEHGIGVPRQHAARNPRRAQPSPMRIPMGGVLPLHGQARRQAVYRGVPKAVVVQAQRHLHLAQGGGHQVRVGSRRQRRGETRRPTPTRRFRSWATISSRSDT